MTKNINKEAEQLVIGQLLLKKDLQMLYLAKIHAKEFALQESIEIIKLIQTRNKSGQLFDLIDLPGNLKTYATICISLTHTGTIDSGLNLVWSAYVARQADRMHMDMDKYSQTKEGKEYFDKMEKILKTYQDKIKKTNNLIPIQDVMVDYIENKTKKQGHTYKFNIGNLSKYGISSGHLATFVARTKAGKTTMLVQIANDMLNKGLPVLFITLEEPKFDIINKFIGIKTGFNLAAIKAYGSDDFSLGDDAMGIIASKIQVLSEQKIFIVDGHQTSLGDIQNYIQKFVEAYGEDGTVFVDQLQHIYHQEREKIVRYDDIMYQLKNYAMDHNVKIILAHQMNRMIEVSGSRFPTTSDIKDSGRVEEASDLLVMFAKEKQDDERSDRLCSVVARHYSGSSFKIGWDREKVKFME